MWTFSSVIYAPLQKRVAYAGALGCVSLNAANTASRFSISLPIESSNVNEISFLSGLILEMSISSTFQTFCEFGSTGILSDAFVCKICVECLGRTGADCACGVRAHAVSKQNVAKKVGIFCKNRFIIITVSVFGAVFMSKTGVFQKIW